MGAFGGALWERKKNAGDDEHPLTVPSSALSVQPPAPRGLGRCRRAIDAEREGSPATNDLKSLYGAFVDAHRSEIIRLMRLIIKGEMPLAVSEMITTPRRRQSIDKDDTGM